MALRQMGLANEIITLAFCLLLGAIAVAVAIAFGIRTEGGEFVFPIDMEARMDDREKQLMARLRRLRDLDAEVRAAETEAGPGRDAESE